MESNISDEGLMRAVTDGDLFAFERLVLRHQQSVWRVAYRMLGCRQAAEDVAQQAFLRIFEARDRYRPTASFRTYLQRIVVRLCQDQLRKRRPIPADDLLTIDIRPDPHEQALHVERNQAVQRAIGRLPLRQRTAVVLRYFEGLNCSEIADSMDTSIKAVERLLARARKTLESDLRFFSEK